LNLQLNYYCSLHFVVTNLLLQNRAVNAVSEVRQAIVKLTSNPADFDEVMFTLESMLADNLHDKSIVEAIVEDIFVQVCVSHVTKV